MANISQKKSEQVITATSNRVELRDEIALRRMIKSTTDAEKAAAEEKKKTFKP